jgi:hypothetical protein
LLPNAFIDDVLALPRAAHLQMRRHRGRRLASEVWCAILTPFGSAFDLELRMQAAHAAAASCDLLELADYFLMFH